MLFVVAALDVLCLFGLLANDVVTGGEEVCRLVELLVAVAAACALVFRAIFD